MMEVTALLVTHNSADVIIHALNVLEKRGVHEIVVVDNASEDSTVASVRKYFPEVKLVENTQNLGFGSACNLGLEEVNTPYVLLINPDAQLYKGSLRIMLAIAGAHPEVAIVAPQLYGADGKPQKSYKDSVLTDSKRGKRYAVPTGNIRAEFIPAAVWLMRMEAVYQIGGFDPQFFLFYEDDDVCVRLREAGFELILAAEAKALHLLGQSSSDTTQLFDRKQYHLIRSYLLFAFKHMGWKRARRLAWKLRFLYLFKWLGYSLLFRRKKRLRYQARLRAAWEGIG